MLHNEISFPWKEYFLPHGSELGVVQAENGWIISEPHPFYLFTSTRTWIFNSIDQVVCFGCEYEQGKNNMDSNSTLTTTNGQNILSTGGGTNYSTVSIDTITPNYSFDPFARIESSPSLNIERVENGFLISYNYRRFVFPTMEEALKFIGESLVSR